MVRSKGNLLIETNNLEYFPGRSIQPYPRPTTQYVGYPRVVGVGWNRVKLTQKHPNG